jgi:hypothetical protein
MSFLAPLYLLAAVAIGLPILFHLIQRRPRGEQLFSSLMFLSPSPPRMVRRSRLDQWLLLLLRALALIAIAFAFMRPFFRSSDSTLVGELGRQRLILVDTSASMQRSGAWDKAVALINATLDESTPQDLVALYRFDSSLTPVVSFDTIKETPRPERINLLRKSLASLKPTWLSTDMGRGLTVAAEAIQGAVNDQSEQESIGGEIIVISDFAGNISLSQLEDFDWPKSVRVVPQVIDVSNKNNATLTALDITGTDKAEEEGLRVLIHNAADSENSQFRLQFVDNSDRVLKVLDTPYQVNANELRIIRLTEIPADATSVQLLGDADPTDNRVYFSVPKKRPTYVWICQGAAEKPELQLGYFVERIPLGSSTMEVFFKQVTPTDLTTSPDAKEVSLVIADASLDEAAATALRSYIEAGGKVVWALDQPVNDSNRQRLETALKAMLADQPAQITEGAVGDYAMWNRIEFQHPLFAPFADARYNDFTKLRTWRYRDIKIDNQDVSRSLVTFDNGAPAILELDIGAGNCWLLASGWQPAESQLALSTKFVPLMLGIFRYSSDAVKWPETVFVGQSLPAIENTTCQKSSGTALEAVAGNWTFADPGIYLLNKGEEISTLSVNVVPSEFQLSQLDPDRLEQLGLNLGALPTAEVVANSQRQLRNLELENQQQVWRWCIALAILFVAMETLWSSVASTRAAAAT